MEKHPAFEYFKSKVPVFRHHIKMSNYGASTAKPTWLYASHDFITDIDSSQQRRRGPKKQVEMVNHYIDTKGKPRIKGGKHMKGSQTYSRAFAQALYKLEQRHRDTIIGSARRAAVDGKATDPEAYRKMASTAKSLWWTKHGDLERMISFLSSGGALS